MIFVDLMGGLGNQLFQYATARALAIDKNVKLFFNLEDYNRQDAKDFKHIEFKLNHFNVNYDGQIKENEITSRPNVNKIIEPLSSINFVDFIDLNKYSGDIHLKGYWQDERYFKRHSDTIKKDLKIISPPNKKNQKLIDEINDVNSICMSFRRGEYLNPYFISQFGMCTEDYYNNALNFIIDKVDSPNLFLFSDDVQWIEDNVKFDLPITPVTINGIGQEHEELRLMTQCKHFILANSSFSWWGAWLSENNDKIVFAPTPWFNSFTKQPILCHDWIHLRCDRSDLFNKSNQKIYELINENDLKLLSFENINKSYGKYGINLNVLNKGANIKFDFKEDINKFNMGEVVIEFKLFSNNDGLIKIDYGGDRNIVLGYKKGYSKRYLHLKGIDFNNISLNMDDEELIIENITIKSVTSDYSLGGKNNIS